MSMIEFARAGVCDVPLYAPEMSSCAVDLTDNTNLWGAPPGAVRAIRECAHAVSRYPSSYSSQLRPALLNYVGLGGVNDVAVVVACGSDEIIDCTLRAFGTPGDRVSYCAPTFSMVPVFAQLNGLVADPLPFAANWDIDPERLVSRRAKITYLCTPNNPTGTEASRAAIEYVVEHAAGIVLLDAAYAEFTGESFDALVRKSERLIVARTFSKAFGLAGLRCGFGVANSKLIDVVARVRGPYKVTVPAEHAVAAALEATADGVQWVRDHAMLASENRVRLTRALTDLGFVVIRSDANFVLVPTQDGQRLFDALRERGVLVRLMSGLPVDAPELAATNGVALRISVGPWEIMDTLLSALRAVL